MLDAVPRLRRLHTVYTGSGGTAPAGRFGAQLEESKDLLGPAAACVVPLPDACGGRGGLLGFTCAAAHALAAGACVVSSAACAFARGLPAASKLAACCFHGVVRLAVAQGATGPAAAAAAGERAMGARVSGCKGNAPRPVHSKTGDSCSTPSGWCRGATLASPAWSLPRPTFAAAPLAGNVPPSLLRV